MSPGDIIGMVFLIWFFAAVMIFVFTIENDFNLQEVIPICIFWPLALAIFLISCLIFLPRKIWRASKKALQ